MVSNHLVRRATAGTVVQLDQAAGDFTLAATAPAKVLFVTAGSGITPVMGMLRNMPDDAADVVVVHSAPTTDDVIFGGELRMLARHGPNPARGAAHRHRRHARHGAPRRTGAGPRRARDVGLRARRDARRPRGPLDGRRHRRPPAHRALPADRDRPPATAARSPSPTTGTTVDADGAQTLLDAGEAAGVLMPSGCRMGICFGCVAPLRAGRRARPAHRRRHHGLPRRQRPHPDLRVRRRGRLRHRLFDQGDST